MATLLSAVTTDTTGSQVDYTAPTTVHASGGFSVVSLQSKTASTNWVTIHTFNPGSPPVAVQITGSYSLRAIANGVVAASPVTVDTTE